jgi:hypothetical protein
MDAFKVLMPTVQKIHDKLERAAVANDLAGYLGVEPSLVLDQLKRAASERRAPSPYQQAQQPYSPALQAGSGSSAIPPMERVLLGALLASDQARIEVLPLLPAEVSHGFATREIFDALRQVNELTGPAAFAALEGRLSPASRGLLHQLIAADDMSDEESSVEQAHACLRKLQAVSWKRQLEEVRSRMKVAEREGRMDEARQLYTQLHQLERERKPERATGDGAGA